MGAEIDLSPDAAKPEGCKNIHHAILEVRRQVAYIQKKKPDGLKYTIAAIDDMIREARPLMNHYGVMIYPDSQSVANEQTYKTSGGSGMREVVVACTWKLVHADSGSELSIQTIGQAADTGDKAVPKGTTAAYKEAIKRIFIIESGNMDPDTYASQQRAAKEATGPARSETYRMVERVIRGCKSQHALSQIWSTRVEPSKNLSENEKQDLIKVRTEMMEQLPAKTPEVGGATPAVVVNGSARRQAAK